MAERLTQERRRELTRQALIGAAADLFAVKGFHATSLEEIAAAAGFTRGAIYSNFKDKEDLIMAVLEWTSDLFAEQMTAVLEEAGEAGEGPEWKRAAEYFGKHVADPARLRLSLEMRLYALRNEEFRLRYAAFHGEHAARLAEVTRASLEREGLKSKFSIDEHAVLMWAASDGLMEHASLDRDNADLYERLSTVLFGLFMGLILRGPPR